MKRIRRLQQRVFEEREAFTDYQYVLAMNILHRLEATRPGVFAPAEREERVHRRRWKKDWVEAISIVEGTANRLIVHARAPRQDQAS